ncbi:MAG: glycerol-3-phosphate acyltransferase [Chloroflexota bacterium]
MLAALAAIGGHSWSVFLRFRGGRGVATFIGGLMALYWPAAVVGGGIMLIVGFVSRYMSLGSITGAVSAFVMCIVLFLTKSYQVEYLAYTVYAMICSIFIFLMHRDNIVRLVSGTERRLGEKAASGNPVAGDHK